MVLSFEFGDIHVEFFENGLNVFEIMFVKSFELDDGLEEVDKLRNTSFEKIESAEDSRGWEIELFSLGHVLKSLLGELVLSNISLMEL